MKADRMYIPFLLLISALALGACGTLQLGVESSSDAGEQLDDGGSPPLEVLVARDTALAYIAAQYAAGPGSEVEWQAVETTPADLVGARSFEFTTPEWMVRLQYPLTAPEAVIYSIEVAASDGSFHWEGSVDADGQVASASTSGGSIPVVAWLGHIASLPAGMAQDDVFILQPESGLEVAVQGADAALESELESLRDAQGQGEYVNVWGSLACEGEGLSGCMLTVDRLLYGAQSESTDAVDGWEGVIYSGPAGPRSGGDDYFALVGPYPVQYGIWAPDEAVRSALEATRDTGTVIRVYGRMLSGVPDWNSTQIQVDRFEVVENPSGMVPAAPGNPETVVKDGWLVYDNERYGYQVQYPPQATLEESGIMGYPSDENGMPVGGLPEGVTLDTYFQYLEDTYGTNLCVQIRTSLGYLLISAPENSEYRYAICGRTGVGAATLTYFDLDVRVDGRYYTAKGMDVQMGSEALAEHNETVYVILDDGTRIEFGSRPVDGATFEDYLMKGRPLLLEILETYVSTR